MWMWMWPRNVAPSCCACIVLMLFVKQQEAAATMCDGREGRKGRLERWGDGWSFIVQFCSVCRFLQMFAAHKHIQTAHTYTHKISSSNNNSYNNDISDSQAKGQRERGVAVGTALEGYFKIRSSVNENAAAYACICPLFYVYFVLCPVPHEGEWSEWTLNKRNRKWTTSTGQTAENCSLNHWSLNHCRRFKSTCS